MRRITVQEALDQGYTKIGVVGLQWQTVRDLHEDIESELNEEGISLSEVALFSKETTCVSISPSTIMDILADELVELDHEVSGRDDDHVYNSIKEHEGILKSVKRLTAGVNLVLKSKCSYYSLTTIGLKSS